MKKVSNILFACDMDGTLLNDQRNISPENEVAIRRFVGKGGLFSLATGRTKAAIGDYLCQLPLNAPYSLLNGSQIYVNEHCVYCAGMPEETKELIPLCLSKFSQLGCEIFDSEDIIIVRMSEVSQYHMKMLHLHYRETTDIQSLNTATWGKINFTGPETEIRALRSFMKAYSDRFCCAASTPTFCEVTPIGTDKGSALQRIATKLFIPKEQIYAIGDSENDFMLLKKSAISFAPANASDEIKNCASIVLPVSNNEHAVAQAIAWIEENQ